MLNVARVAFYNSELGIVRGLFGVGRRTATELC
jgi:hypothetical protein